MTTSPGRARRGKRRRRIRYFHASPRRLPVGTVLAGAQERRNYRWSVEHDGVYLTTDPVPHFTILARAREHGWHVYQVEPEGQVRDGGWADLVAPRARIVRYVGTARGLSARRVRRAAERARRTGNEDEARRIERTPYSESGSRALPREPLAARRRRFVEALERWPNPLPAHERARLSRDVF